MLILRGEDMDNTQKGLDNLENSYQNALVNVGIMGSFSQGPSTTPFPAQIVYDRLDIKDNIPKDDTTREPRNEKEP